MIVYDNCLSIEIWNNQWTRNGSSSTLRKLEIVIGDEKNLDSLWPVYTTTCICWSKPRAYIRLTLNQIKPQRVKSVLMYYMLILSGPGCLLPTNNYSISALFTFSPLWIVEIHGYKHHHAQKEVNSTDTLWKLLPS